MKCHKTTRWIYVLMAGGFVGLFGCGPGGNNNSMSGPSVATKYSCSGSSCVADTLGPFTTATCDNSCGSGGGGGTGDATGCTVSGATMTTSVSAQNFYFVPSCITVTAGQTVTWTNDSTIVHTVTSDPGDPTGFNSGNLTGGSQYAFSFTVTGTYGYHCTFHQSMGMIGTVIVQ